MYTNQFFPKFHSAVLFQKRSPVAATVDDAYYRDHTASQQASYSSSNAIFGAEGAAGVPGSSGSLVILASLCSAFLLLALLGSTFYYYHQKRRSSWSGGGGNGGLSSWFRLGGGSSHKVLLVKKSELVIPGHLDKGFFISSYSSAAASASAAAIAGAANATGSTTGTPTGTGPTAKSQTRAVRSPSSGQVNPFQKKSPSPTSATASVSSVVHGFGAPITEEHHHQSAAVPGKAAEINNNVTGEEVHSGGGGKAKVLGSLENLREEGTSSGASKKKEGSLSSSSKKSSLDGGGSLGQMHFKLKYSYEKKSLSVVVVRCEGLQSSSKEGTATGALLDPYVKLQLLPEKQHKAKTRVLRKTVSPVYNEEFTFLGIAASSLENLVVHFVVLNFDRFARDEILGEVVCKVNQLEFDALEKQISLTQEIAPRGNKLKIQELGELLVSLCYQPIANRLTVVVLKARNLPKMDLTGLCDPYVKIYVFHNGNRLFKKRTHVKKRTLSPVFNESFVFDLPPEEGLENISLQCQVYDHDRVTRNELIGKVDISGRTPGCPAAEKHWHEVIRSPRRQIAEWHKLVEC